jgi:hypothetical protein
MFSFVHGGVRVEVARAEHIATASLNIRRRHVEIGFRGRFVLSSGSELRDCKNRGQACNGNGRNYLSHSPPLIDKLVTNAEMDWLDSTPALFQETR